jgi:hypothetical protein
MSGTRIFTASLFILASASLAAAQDYFPLQVGNQWVYRLTSGVGASSQVAEVTRTAAFGGRQYVFYSGLEGGLYLREGDDGSLYAWDPQSQSETLIAPFPNDDGAFQPSPNTCRQTGSVASRNAKYKGPLGEFDNALEIRYSPGSCADAGVVKEVYLPWVGLVQRTTTTIAGPRTYDLVYARLGGITVISAPEVSFGVTLDQSVYQAGARMLARLTVRSTQPDPLQLPFSSGQMYDLAIQNDKGDRVYLWSAGRAFTQMVQTVAVQGEKNFALDVPLDGLPAGQYVVQAWLTTTGDRRWTASVPFQIQ